MIDTLINGKWSLKLPKHRADRPEWKIENGGWEKERLQALYDNITKNDVVFEIGAEEGDMSALLSEWCNGNIVLFEPNPKVWPNIKAIWDANNIKYPLGLFIGFAGNNDDFDRFTQTQSFVLNNDRWPECAYGEVIGNHGFRHLAEEADVTPTIKIDTFRNMFGVIPSIINMDIEGAEFEALKGAEQTLRMYHPKIFVSVHPEFMQHYFQQHWGDLRKYVEDLGYKHHILAYDHEMHIYFEPIKS